MLDKFHQAVHGKRIVRVALGDLLGEVDPLLGGSLSFGEKVDFRDGCVKIDRLLLYGGVDRRHLVFARTCIGKGAKQKARYVAIPIVKRILGKEHKGSATVALGGLIVVLLLVNLFPTAELMVNFGRIGDQPAKYIVLDGVAHFCLGFAIGRLDVDRFVAKAGGVTRLAANGCGQAGNAAYVLGGLSDGSADAALFERHPKLGVIFRDLARWDQLLAGEVFILVFKAVLLLPSTADLLALLVDLAIVPALIAVLLNSYGFIGELVFVIESRVVVVAHKPAVFGEGIGVEALVLLLLLGHGTNRTVAFDGARIVIMANEPVGIVGKPGNLLVCQAVFKDPAHLVYGQFVKDLFFEVILLVVGAQGLDHAVARRRIGLRVGAGP